MKPVGDVDEGGKEVEDEILIESDTLIQLFVMEGGLLQMRITGCCVLLQNITTNGTSL